jgi:hypothetical protein
LGVRVERAQVLFGFDELNRVNLIFDQRRLAGVAPRARLSAPQSTRDVNTELPRNVMAVTS